MIALLAIIIPYSRLFFASLGSVIPSRRGCCVFLVLIYIKTFLIVSVNA